MSRTILVVDDDPLIRRLIATTLEDVAGFDLVEAGDGVVLLLGEAERLIDADDLAGEASDVDPAGLTASVADRFEAGERAVQRAAYRAETLVRDRDAADKAHAAAEAAHLAAKALREKQEHRSRSRVALEVLEAQAASISRSASPSRSTTPSPAAASARSASLRRCSSAVW